MVRTIFVTLVSAVVLAAAPLAWAQDEATTTQSDDTPIAVDETNTSSDTDATDVDAADPAVTVADPDAENADEGAAEENDAGNGIEVVEGAQEAIEGMAENVDQSEQAKKISAGILNPIYTLAERLSFPYFHWLAFAAMVTGVISFALQLVLGKLIVLSRMSLSPSEILADSLGLVISLVGLVLTTQAAAENSTFTTSSFAVISSTAVGIIAGFIFYLWGQRQELLAVEGRRRVAAAEKIAAANKK